ncbi:MAG: hypothetical protein AAF840_09675, partial [Bacteroidota bacterium]
YNSFLMTPAVASLINALLLISLGGYGYFSSDTPSVTALIPLAFGLILLFCNRGVKSGNKVIAHVAVLLTLLVLIGLFKPLFAAIGREDTSAAIRVAIMLVSSVVAMVYFVRNFIQNRKLKEAAEGK